MKNKNTTSRYFDITHRSPSFYSGLYLANMFLFSLIYRVFFCDDFSLDMPINYIGALYFSVITVTTLGYGDITPNLGSDYLLVAIILQVGLGVITIGMFLNSLSHKLNVKRAELKQKEDDEISSNNLAKLLTILKPDINSYLGILAETYKVTANEEKGVFTVKPEKLFGLEYYDQISRQDFLSLETRYGKGKMKWGEFIIAENKKFVQDIDNFLNKFATNLPINVVELLVKLQKHIFLDHAERALSSHNLMTQFGLDHLTPKMNILTVEHSSVNTLGKPETIKDFHQTLLELISIIDNSLPDSLMEITIYLTNGTAPPVGSAIGDIIKVDPFKDFGPFETQKAAWIKIS